MATEYSTPSSRYVTLRDYLRVLRRYWVMIAVVAAVGALAGFAQASSQTTQYQATAQVGFQDPSQQLSIVGLGSAFVQTPGELASVNQSLAVSPSVIDVVRRQLHTTLSVAGLIRAISTQVVVASGLLEISATANNPTFAADLANAVSRTLVAQDNAQTRAEFLRLAANIRARISRLARRSVGSASGQLAFYEDELARLETVAAFAKSAQLVVSAQKPPGAGSSRTRGTILGLVLGLLLAVFVAFGRDATDPRLRSLRDIRSSFDLPLLGHVRNESMGRIADVAKASKSRRADELEAFRILRRNLELLDPEHSPSRVLVTSAAPAEGKTTVASSLAFAIAAAGKRTLLIDCDLRRPTLARRLGIEPAPGVADYLGARASLPELLRTVEFTELSTREGTTPSDNGHVSPTGTHSLSFIASGAPNSRSAELLGSERFAQLLEEAQRDYDVLVLDSSPLLPVSDTLEIVPHVDAIVVCARDSQTTRDQAAGAGAALARFPERPTGLVITGIKRRSESDFYAYSYDYS